MKKKTELRLVDLGQIKPWGKNPRFNDEAVPAIEKSIRAHGYLDFIETDEKLHILAGHTRLKALESIASNGGIAGIKNVIDGKIPILVHYGLKHKDAYRLANNKTGEFADWDLPALKDILEGLDTDEFTGWNQDEINRIFQEIEEIGDMDIGIGHQSKCDPLNAIIISVVNFIYFGDRNKINTGEARELTAQFQEKAAEKDKLKLATELMDICLRKIIKWQNSLS